MGTAFHLTDGYALGDLHTYVQRAARVYDGAARLIAEDGVLGAYTAILYPRGLLDTCPTVLGLRTFALTCDATFDAVIPLRSLLGRLSQVRINTPVGDQDAAFGVTDAANAYPTPGADGGSAMASVPEHSFVAPDALGGDPAPSVEQPGIRVELPQEVHTVTWAGISPPRTGWRELGSMDAAQLLSLARAGSAEVAGEVRPGVPESVVQRALAEVWSAPIPGLEYLPTGVAFAAFILGFLADDPVRVYETGPWHRLSMERGHVLVRQRNWSLRQ